MMGPQARVLRSAQRRIVAHLRATRAQAQVEPAQGLFNFRCHENCVQWVRQRPDEDLEVVETVYVDGGEPILHYVVRERATGRLLEVTLGWRAKQLEYYPVRTLLPEDLDHIHAEFDRSLTHWLEAYVPWWGRVLLGIGRCL